MTVQSSPVDSSSSQVSVPSSRTIRIGLLGLGQVGQAVARLAEDETEVDRIGIRFVLARALVRDVTRPRACLRRIDLTSSSSEFLSDRYDVVIEALDSVEPARGLVAQLLWRGTPVVTANKALVAEHGQELRAIAAESGASFRYEACALSAVPFLGALAARPLVASVDRVTAIVNGTSNFLLTRLGETGSTFASALDEAQRAGYAEPDPSRDVDGLDAADKLTLLASLFGWGSLSRGDVDVQGIGALTAADLAAARETGGEIKPIVWAVRRASGIEAFVGPALLSSREPLAAIAGALNGIRLDGKYVSNLFFSGPGAGPDVTAATLLDDAIEAASAPCQPRLETLERVRHGLSADRSSAGKPNVSSPITRWFSRLTFPGVVPSDDALRHVLVASGFELEQIAGYGAPSARWITVGLHSRGEVESAGNYLRSTHRIETSSIRRI